MPFPREDTTPPVTKIYFVSTARCVCLCCLRTLLLCPLSPSDWLSATSSPLEEEAIASTRARLIRVILGLYRCHAK